MPQPLEEAIHDALRDASNSPGMCLQQTRTWYEIPSKYPDATSGWYATDFFKMHDRNPPRGAVVWWVGGSNGHGHVAMSLGDGTVRSTDAAGRGRVGTRPLAWFEQNWGLQYKGWSADINDVVIPELKAIYDGVHAPPPLVPQPPPPQPSRIQVTLSKLKYGTRGDESVKHLQSVLNGHSLEGGQTLPLTGNYLDETDEEVRLCQAQHGHIWNEGAPDRPKRSYVGPGQAGHLFGPNYWVV
jgi:hypothetical protein